jgi:hypothetical protein
MTHTRGRTVLRELRSAAASVVVGSGTVVRGVGFWTAIVLPVIYVPLILIGHPWAVDAVNFAKVVALHVASLFVGRGHSGQ